MWSPSYLEPMERKRKKGQGLENPKGNRRLTPGVSERRRLERQA